MTADIGKRPWVAALLALVYPGLGHVYVQSWHRALLWFGAVVLTAVLFIPQGVFTGVAAVGDVPAALSQVPTEAVAAIALVAAFNVVDAYITARQTNVVEGVRCTRCNKPVDEELSFCHWCTLEFQGEHA